ncbi:MAG: alpha/beta hydrolase [Solobacterium sp.]|nr:alpha/beta hydrolase [Solobacterium sp.]
MSQSFEEFVKEICFVSKMQDQHNAEKELRGERVSFPSDGAQIEAILYKTPQPDAVTIVTAYGGGFVMGGCATDDHMWASLSDRLGANIVSIGYRKAPDFPFPTAMHDVYNGLCWVADHAVEYGLNAEKLVVMGASAGGNLAATASILDHMRGTNHVKLQILHYPYIDLDTDPAVKGHAESELAIYRLFAELYAPKDMRRNPMVSPLYAKDELHGLPPAWIITAGNDPLQREGMQYGENMKKAGNEVHIFSADEMPHGYFEGWFSLTDDRLPEGEVFYPGNTMELFHNGKLESETDKTVNIISQAFLDVFG